jgi:hypothetical protein
VLGRRSVFNTVALDLNFLQQASVEKQQAKRHLHHFTLLHFTTLLLVVVVVVVVVAAGEKNNAIQNVGTFGHDASLIGLPRKSWRAFCQEQEQENGSFSLSQQLQQFLFVVFIYYFLFLQSTRRRSPWRLDDRSTGIHEHWQDLFLSSASSQH